MPADIAGIEEPDDFRDHFAPGDAVMGMHQTTTSSPSEIDLQIAAFHQPAVDSARKMIIWAGVIYPVLPILLFAMLARFVGGSIFATPAFLWMFGIGVAVFGLHLALAAWVKKSPLPATSVALTVFVAYQVALAHYGYFSNLLVTAVGLFVLGRGVLAGYRIHKLRRMKAIG